MQNDLPGRTSALARLQALVGEWTEEAVYPGAPPGRTVFEWEFGGQFLIQRSEIPHPGFPDTIAVISVDANGETYTRCTISTHAAWSACTR